MTDLSRLESLAEQTIPWIPGPRDDEQRRRFGTRCVIIAGVEGYRASAARYVFGPLRATKAEAAVDLERLDREGSALAHDPAFGSWAAHSFRCDS